MILDELKHYKPYSISPGYLAQKILYGTNHADIIAQTTYPSLDESHLAIEGIVHSHIHHDFVYAMTYEQSLFFTIKHNHKKEAYLEYSLNEQRMIMASVDTYSSSLYRLLFTAINYLYNEYQIEEFSEIYHHWRKIDMSSHLQGQDWDANEYTYVQTIAQALIKHMQDILSQQDCFLFLHYDSVEELCQHRHIQFNSQSLSNTFLFQNDKHQQLLDLQSQDKALHSFTTSNNYTVVDIHRLYNKTEMLELPLFLQESIKDNERLYMQNRAFLDMNDFDLIKSFQRGKTWSCLYYGPSGTGKTTKLLCIAGALGLPALKMVGSRSIDEASLFGKYVLRNGETVFEYGPLSLMMKYGGMFIFDEINMVDSDIISSLNDVLDGTRQKILDNGEIIHAHPHFRFGESMNIGYSGTNEMNISHKSRIQNKIKLSQLPLDKMAQIIVKETDIEPHIAQKMAALLEPFHQAIINEGNETTQRIDLRTLIHWAHKSVDLDNDVIRASLVTIIADLAEEDEEILNVEDVRQIMATNGVASTIMSLIVETFVVQDKEISDDSTHSI